MAEGCGEGRDENQQTDDTRFAPHGSGHRHHRGVAAVAGAESVIHIDVGQLGQLDGESGVALLLAGMETEVFQDQDLAGLQGGRSLLHFRADDLIDLVDGVAGQ